MTSIFERVMQKEYDAWGHTPPDHAWCGADQTQVEVRFLQQALSLSPEHTILDLYCSWGRHAAALTQLGYRVIGVDISRPMLTAAKQNALGNNAAFVKADVKGLPFTAALDIIYAVQSSAFEAWRTPEEILHYLRCVHRALKLGGHYLFGWPDNWNRADVAESRWRHTLADEQDIAPEDVALQFHFYGFDEQVSLLERVGFRVTKTWNTYDDVHADYQKEQPGLIILANTVGL